MPWRRPKPIPRWVESNRRLATKEILKRVERWRAGRGTPYAGHAQVDAAETSPPERRWSKRSQIVIVSSLVVAALLLTATLIRFARTTGLVLRVIDDVGDVDRIAPDRQALTRTSVTPQPHPPSETAPSPMPPAPAPATTNAPPPGPLASPPSAAPMSASNGGRESTDAVEANAMGGAGGSGDVSDSNDDVASRNTPGATAGAGGVAGSSAAAPTFWDDVVQSALGWIGQTTVSMCGPSTCNTGMVCCNASCGTCVEPGATCDQTQCAGAPRTPTNIRCGMGQCNDGQVCCNPSCGICTAPGETCSDAPCP